MEALSTRQNRIQDVDLFVIMFSVLIWFWKYIYKKKQHNIFQLVCKQVFMWFIFQHKYLLFPTISSNSICISSYRVVILLQFSLLLLVFISFIFCVHLNYPNRACCWRSCGFIGKSLRELFYEIMNYRVTIKFQIKTHKVDKFIKKLHVMVMNWRPMVGNDKNNVVLQQWNKWEKHTSKF